MKSAIKFLKDGVQTYGEILVQVSKVSFQVVQEAIELSGELKNAVSETRQVQALDQKLSGLAQETAVNVVQALDANLSSYVDSLKTQAKLLDEELKFVKREKQSLSFELRDVQAKARKRDEEFQRSLSDLELELKATHHAKAKLESSIEEYSKQLDVLAQNNSSQVDIILNLESEKKQAIQRLDENQNRFESLEKSIKTLWNQHTSEIEQLENEKDNLQKHIECRREELKNRSLDLRKANEEISRSEKTHRPKNFSGLKEVLYFASNRFDDVFVIWESAFDSADESPLRNADKCEKVYRCFEALAKTARERQTLKIHGHPTPTLEKSLIQHGVNDYKETETKATKDAYGRERLFYRKRNERDRCKQVWQHLTIDGHTQIYFEVNDELGSVDIAYCGKHLSIPSYRR